MYPRSGKPVSAMWLSLNASTWAFLDGESVGSEQRVLQSTLTASKVQLSPYGASKDQCEVPSIGVE